jgi:hypothetical protein
VESCWLRLLLQPGFPCLEFRRSHLCQECHNAAVPEGLAGSLARFAGRQATERLPDTSLDSRTTATVHTPVDPLCVLPPKRDRQAASTSLFVAWS